MSEIRLPIQPADTGISAMTTFPDGSVNSGTWPWGSRRRSIWSLVHLTVATVGMPSRW